MRHAILIDTIFQMNDSKINVNFVVYNISFSDFSVVEFANNVKIIRETE